MGYLFESTLNTRPILGNSDRYVRSDVPTVVTEKEKCLLLEKGITVIVDLRTAEERAKKPCPLAHDVRFRYVHRPIRGGDAVPATVSEVPRSYINMVDPSLLKTVELILSEGANVLYFCNAGKDRTGVVSAILLYKLGLDDDDIVADYMQSRDNLEAPLAAFAAKTPTVDIEVITPRASYIRDFLSWLKKNLPK